MNATPLLDKLELYHKSLRSERRMKIWSLWRSWQERSALSPKRP